MTVQGKRSTDVNHPEHITAEWVLLAIRTFFSERQCSSECKEVAVLKQEAKDNHEMMIDMRSDIKDIKKNISTMVWGVFIMLATAITVAIITHLASLSAVSNQVGVK